MTRLSQLSLTVGVSLLFTFQSVAVRAQHFGYGVSVGPMLIGHNMNMQMSMMNNLAMMRWSYRDNMFTNTRLTFVLTLPDATSKEVKSKIYMDTLLRKTYIVDVDKSSAKDNPKSERRIYPADAKTTNVKGSDYMGTFVPQLTTDSCWMFKIIDGDLNVYSNGLAIVALSKLNGKLIPFSKAALQEMLKDDPKASKYFTKEEYIKAIDKYNSDVHGEDNTTSN